VIVATARPAAASDRAIMPRTIRRRLACVLGILLILGAGSCRTTDATATGGATAPRKPVFAPIQKVPESRDRLKPVKNLYPMPKFWTPRQKAGALFSLPETRRHHRS
jgi:hypothetical protein